MAEIVEFRERAGRQQAQGRKEEPADELDEEIARIGAEELTAGVRAYLRASLTEASGIWGLPGDTYQMLLAKVCEGLQEMALRAMTEGGF